MSNTNTRETRTTAAADPAAPMLVEAWTDGGCSGNPGPGGWAVVFWRDGQTIAEHSGFIPGPTTNNRAELIAVREGLTRAPGAEPLEIVTDSRNVIGWLQDGWRRKDPDIAALCGEIDALLIVRGGVRFRHVRGHAGDALNERADKLAVAAIRRG